ncbi:hypothetical protein H0H87_006456 [Tephrocybe sp. NHM501043]|nr:hypothetical protein H0H87_006456 [Tephrocybe sp. NHM501043]
MFTYSGSWAAQTQNGVPNATVSAPFHQTTQVDASLSFSFSGANAIVVKGLSSSENGIYSVVGGLSDINICETITELNSSQSLDGQTNTFNGTSMGDTTPPPSQTSPTRVGVIAGPIAGSVLLLIALGIFIWLRRRRRSQSDSGQFSFFTPRTKPVVPPRPSSDIISPMLATFNSQGERSMASDARSTYTGTSSDVHSLTNLLKGSVSHGRRSVRSNTSSDAAVSISQPSQMSSFAGWETGHGMHVPSMQYQYNSSSSHRTGPSIGSSSQISDRTQQTQQTQQTSHRLTIETSVSSLPEFESPRRRIPGQPAPDYISMSPRGPLPNIPIPSYDAALEAPGLSPDEVKHMPGVEVDETNDIYRSHRRARRYSALTALTTRTAPPQYER